MFKDCFLGSSSLSEISYIIHDDDGFSFTCRFSNSEDRWKIFFQDFVAGYEARDIDPIPNLIKYLGYRLTDSLWTKHIDILKEGLPKYKDRIEKLMVLM